MNKGKRYIAIDILKLICAFAVVCIHIPFYGIVGKYIIAISRIAVPIFFMISGYFWENTKKKNKQLNSIKKYLMIAIGANILYAIWDIILYHNNISKFINCFKVSELIKLILFNESPFAIHLWYLTAILYTVLVIIVLEKYNILPKFKNTIILILLMGDLLFGKYSLLIFKKEIPFYIVRNFLFVGVPYFLIGDSIHNNMEKIKKHISINKVKICIVIFAILNCIERYLLVKYNINATRDHYICTTLLSVSVFIYVLLYNETKKCEYNMNKDFSKYSLVIYVIHPMVAVLINKIVNILNISSIYNLIAPIIIFIITFIIAIIYYKIKNKMTNYKNK